MKKIRVLLVDDSPTMLRLLANALESDHGIEVVGLAHDVDSARAAIRTLCPDVVTLDVEMPGMSGMEFLEKIMRLRPMPVVMVSAHTARESEIAVEALQRGAIDCVVKPTAGCPDSLNELAGTIRMAARSNPKARSTTKPSRFVPENNAVDFKAGKKVVAIGSSIGGVEALITVLQHFPEECAPTVIVQHLPANFMAGLVSRLDRNCAAKVVAAVDGEALSAGHVYLAPSGGMHLELTGKGPFHFKLAGGENVSGHRPSVDVLFASVARCAGANSVGVILTGMGRDGAAGILAMRKNGARTIGQNEATSVVYGMPRAAFELGGVELQLPIDKIGAEIVGSTAFARA